MTRSRSLTASFALVAASLAAILLLPNEAWSQFRSVFSTSTTSPTVTGGSSDGDSSADASAAASLVAISATSSTIAGPGRFTPDTTDFSQNVIYEVFGAAAVDVCMTIDNVGRVGEVRTIVDGFEVGTRIRVGRTRSRCFAAPQRIELRCTNTLCEALWRIDAL